MTTIRDGDVIGGIIILRAGKDVSLCKCRCGARSKFSNKRIMLGDAKCKSCYQVKPIPKGTRFGHWVTLGDHFKCEYKEGWVELCRCDCGTERYVSRSSLRNTNGSRSCGPTCDALALSKMKAAKPEEISNLNKHCKVVGNDTGFKPKEATPCEALPGSKNKIMELQRRLEAGEELFSEHDPLRVDELSDSARMDDDNIFNNNYINKGNEYDDYVG